MKERRHRLLIISDFAFNTRYRQTVKVTEGRTSYKKGPKLGTTNEILEQLELGWSYQSTRPDPSWINSTQISSWIKEILLHRNMFKVVSILLSSILIRIEFKLKRISIENQLGCANMFLRGVWVKSVSSLSKMGFNQCKSSVAVRNLVLFFLRHFCVPVIYQPT